MEGRAVFKWAVNLLADSIRDVLTHAGLSASDVSCVVLHQANRRILDAAAEHLGIAADKLVVNLDRYGNTSAASIPLALDEIHRGAQSAAATTCCSPALAPGWPGARLCCGGREEGARDGG